MAQITVTLEKWLEGQNTRPSILTRVYALDIPEKTPAKPRTMMIAAGPTPGTGATVDLPAGKYLFEAYLPNGDVASQTVTVQEGLNDPVTLRASDSPHEWLSWQHLAGYSRGQRRPAKDLVAKPVVLEGVTGVDPGSAFVDVLVKVWKGASPDTLQWTTLAVPPRPHAADPLVDTALGVTAYLYGSGPWHDGGRYYGLVRHPPAGPPLLAVLPVPWHQIDFSGDALVDVVVDSSDANLPRREWPVRVSVVVRDNVMASVFGYLSSGDLPAAERVAGTAVDFLYSKGENALAAAGGAYALVRIPIDPKRPPVWVPWLENLRNWFPWLPDGAILDGWAHLNGIGRTPNVAEAAAAFVDATQRGVPFYTMGVKLLFDGLTRAEAELKAPPKGFARALEFARRMAFRVDVRQTFTVVRLS